MGKEEYLHVRPLQNYAIVKSAVGQKWIRIGKKKSKSQIGYFLREKNHQRWV